jgi:hypothetical protein
LAWGTALDGPGTLPQSNQRRVVGVHALARCTRLTGALCGLCSFLLSAGKRRSLALARAAHMTHWPPAAADNSTETALSIALTGCRGVCTRQACLTAVADALRLACLADLLFVIGCRHAEQPYMMYILTTDYLHSDNLTNV